MEGLITCIHCQKRFPLGEALKKHFIEQAVKQQEKTLEKFKVAERQRIRQEYTIQLKESRKDVSAAAKQNKRLVEDYASLKEEVRQLNAQAVDDKKNLQQEYEQKLQAQQKQLQEKIQDELYKEVRLKELEKDKQLKDALKQVKKLEQEVKKSKAGLQQNTGYLQGEVLELDIESKLRQSFPFDDVAEVKKFHRGADVRQIVKNRLGAECGFILWEVKNAKWTKAWIARLKNNVQQAKANIGILATKEGPPGAGDMGVLDRGLWFVKPHLAIALAAAIRNTLIEVYQVSQSSQLKDEQMQHLHDYITSPEFKHKMEALLDTFSQWREAIIKERRWFVRKWSQQEKNDRKANHEYHRHPWRLSRNH